MGKFVRQHGDLIVLAVFIMLAPFFFKNSFYFTTVNIVGINAISLIGMNLVMGYSGILSLAQATFFGLGAYVTGYLVTHYQVDSIAVIMISCAVVMVIAFLVGKPLLKLPEFPLTLGTMGFVVIVFTLINSWNEVGASNGIRGISSFKSFLGSISGNFAYFYFIWITVLVTVLLSKNLISSKEGRALKAIHSDEHVAAVFGISVSRSKMKAFLVSACLGALAGSYYASYMKFISPEALNLKVTIEMVIMLMLGGIGTILGPIVGPLVYQIINELGLLFLHDYELIIKGVILLAIILFFPTGIMGGILKLGDFRKSKKKNNASTSSVKDNF